jgi:formate-dependent nitrite reductase membrane component NrfD
MTWKEKVSGYLVTKAIAAGAMLVAALLVLLGHEDEQAAVGVVPPIVAGLFLAITGALLIADLKQPGRFHYLITKGSWESWLVKGAYILMGFAALTALWWFGGLADSGGLLQVLAIPTALFAAGTAGYTAYLFAQCEGRDLWQTPLLLPILLAQSVTAGGAVFTVLDLFMDVPEPTAIRWALLGGVLATASLVATELSAHGTRHVELAIEAMTKGQWRNQFWGGGIALGLVVPAVLTVIALAADLGPAVPAIGGLAAVSGMWFYEDSFIRAGQSVPLS